MYWKVSVFLKRVLTSSIDFAWNLVPLYIIVSKHIETFIQEANLHHPTIKFTAEISDTDCVHSLSVGYFGRELLTEVTHKL